jgi:hypothetical protein
MYNELQLFRIYSTNFIFLFYLLLRKILILLVYCRLMYLLMIRCVFLEEESNLRIFLRKSSCSQIPEAECCCKEPSTGYSASCWLQCWKRIKLSHLKKFNERCWIKNLGKEHMKCYDDNTYIFLLFHMLKPFRKQAFIEFIHLFIFLLFPLEHTASVKHFVSLQFLNLKQSVGLLERVISPSQGRCLHTGQHKHRINADRHQCLEWDSTPRSQC